MFRKWKPLGERLGTYPGLDLEVRGRDVSVVWEEWINGECVFKMRIEFGRSIAGLMVWDESPIGFQPGELSEDAFDRSEPGDYSAWIDRESNILQSYDEYARMLYDRIDRYHFWGQDVVVLLDVADTEPKVTIEVPRVRRNEP